MTALPQQSKSQAIDHRQHMLVYMLQGKRIAMCAVQLQGTTCYGDQRLGLQKRGHTSVA